MKIFKVLLGIVVILLTGCVTTQGNKSDAKISGDYKELLEKVAMFEAGQEIVKQKINKVIYDFGETLTEEQKNSMQEIKYPPEVLKKLKALEKEYMASSSSIERLYLDFIGKHPQNGPVLEEFGDWLYDNGQSHWAVQVWQRAVYLGYESPELYVGIGAVLSHAGKIRESYEAFQKALELDPDNADAHFSLATTYFTRRYDIMDLEGWGLETTYWKSQEEYEKAWQCEPENFTYAKSAAENYYMAHFFGVTDSVERSLALWDKCLAAASNDYQKAHVYINKGRILRKDKRYSEAKVALEKALEFAPDNRVAKNLYDRVCKKLK